MTPIQPSCLYPDDKEIARLVVGKDPERIRAFTRAVKADHLPGFPPINPLMGGRYWPKVKLYFDQRAGLRPPDPAISPALNKRLAGRIRIVPFAPDGEETFDAEKEAARRRRRRPPAGFGKQP